jgi:hypothetical protein
MPHTNNMYKSTKNIKGNLLFEIRVGWHIYQGNAMLI